MLQVHSLSDFWVQSAQYFSSLTYDFNDSPMTWSLSAISVIILTSAWITVSCFTKTRHPYFLHDLKKKRKDFAHANTLHRWKILRKLAEWLSSPSTEQRNNFTWWCSHGFRWGGKSFVTQSPGWWRECTSWYEGSQDSGYVAEGRCRHQQQDIETIPWGQQLDGITPSKVTVSWCHEMDALYYWPFV